MWEAEAQAALSVIKANIDLQQREREREIRGI